MPWPPPMNSQIARWPGRACERRGNHEMGTVTTRPSESETVRSLSDTSTRTAVGLLAETKVLIPDFNQTNLVLFRQFFNAPQFHPCKPAIPGQAHRSQPELRFRLVSLNMDVRRLIAVTSIKEEA